MQWQDRLKSLELSEDEEAQMLGGIASNIEYADIAIENAIGYFPIPIGIVKNVKINDKTYNVPIATEEASVIAALIKINHFISKKGYVTTKKLSYLKLGTLYTKDDIIDYIIHNKDSIISDLNSTVASGLFSRGGGVKNIEITNLNNIYRIDIKIDTMDSMGANKINQICEYTKLYIEQNTNSVIELAILSNLNKENITTSTIIIKDVSEKIGKRIELISHIANIDLNRASTHNKGIMNAIDGMLIATGNDFRANAADMHSYASSSGKYMPFSNWKYKDNILTGYIEAPISAATVGGATDNPIASIALKILNITNADELCQICAAVGLMQNLAAIKALATDGIVHGHMRLHLKHKLSGIKNSNQKNKIYNMLIEQLSSQKYLSSEDIENAIHHYEN